MLYEQGVEKSTLADIAAAADVPLGNVYYYFKTKDALVSAVIEGYRHDLRRAERPAEPAARNRPSGSRPCCAALTAAARTGWPATAARIGSLSSELDKRDDDLRAEVATILAGLIDWAEVQFRAMGRDDARELAVALIAAYEGIAVLAAALRDPGLISTEASRLEPLDRLFGETSAARPELTA